MVQLLAKTSLRWKYLHILAIFAYQLLIPAGCPCSYSKLMAWGKDPSFVSATAACHWWTFLWYSSVHQHNQRESYLCTLKRWDNCLQDGIFCNPGYNFTELLCDPTVKLLYFNSINIALRLLELMSKYTDVFYIEGIVGLLYLTISCPLNMLQAKMIESFWIGISCRCLCVNWKRERRTCCGISSSLYCIIFLGTKSAEWPLGHSSIKHLI